MRKFRNAALAGLTALSLVAGATTATAAEMPGSSAGKVTNPLNSNSDDQIGNNGMTAAQRYDFFKVGADIVRNNSLEDVQNMAVSDPKGYKQAMAAYNYFATFVVPPCQDAYDLQAERKDEEKLAALKAAGKEDTQEYKELNERLTTGAVTRRLAELKKDAENNKGAKMRWDNIEKLAVSLRPDMERFDPIDPNCETNPLYNDLKYASSNPKSGSSVLGKRYNAQKDVNAKDLVGSTKNFSRQPVWSQIWIAVTAIGVIGSLIGLVFFPFMNQLKNQQVII